jgi:hypothetical protein
VYVFITYICVCVLIHRVFHDLWTLLQEVISKVFVIKKVHINMCPILDGYGVMDIFNSRTRPRVNRVLQNQLEGGVGEYSPGQCILPDSATTYSISPYHLHYSDCAGC